MSTKKSNSLGGPSQHNQEMYPDKLKVLCLHGYRQSGEGLKSKLGSFRKFVAKYADFVFVTAPHIAPPLEGSENATEDQKGWWFNKDDRTFKGTNQCGPAFGFEESLRLVERVWQEEGPFQGLLGFSQGACFVGLLCSLAARGMTTVHPDFAILSSGFCSGSLVHKNCYEDPITIPTLHIFGESDEIIPREMSELLSSTFENPEILTHPGGHYFPATVQQKQFYINYFQDRLQNYLEAKEIKKDDCNATDVLIRNS